VPGSSAGAWIEEVAGGAGHRPRPPHTRDGRTPVTVAGPRCCSGATGSALPATTAPHVPPGSRAGRTIAVASGAANPNRS
jgi:hypothetical protein